MGTMTEKNTGLTWARWLSFAVVGLGLPVAAWQRSLAGPVDLPVLADIATSAFYILALACLGVALAASLPRGR